MSSLTPESTLEKKNSRLLIIDHDSSVLRIAKLILNRARYEVLTSQNPEEALHLLSQSSFDCIIVGSNMPTMSGYDIAKQIRQQPLLKDIPILMFTQKHQVTDVPVGIDAGITDYVVKPIDAHILVDKVECYINNRKHLFELPVFPTLSAAELKIQCKIQSISESDITLRLSSLISKNHKIAVQGKVFDDIGIIPPRIKLTECKKTEENPTYPGMPYEARCSFINTPEIDLMKIRAWINREALKRRK